MNNRRLVDGSYTDGNIKPQGLNGKYEVALANSQIENSNDFHVNVPAEVLTPEIIDNNYIKEEDLLNDLVETNGNNDSLFPEGIELWGEGDEDTT